MLSWGRSYPELLTTCYDNGKPTFYKGHLDVLSNTTWAFLRDFFREIAEVFPDRLLHIGGDEVPQECW